MTEITETIGGADAVGEAGARSGWRRRGINMRSGRRMMEITGKTGGADGVGDAGTRSGWRICGSMRSGR